MFRLLLTLALLAFSFSPAQAATRRKKSADAATRPAVKPSGKAAVKAPHLSSALGRRNVILVLVDDLNDGVGWLGGPAQTPHMDKLAHLGMRFTNAQAAHTLGNASRIALFTGLLPSSSGVFSPGQEWWRAVPLQGTLTLPEFLLAGGYTTAAAGSVFQSGHGGAHSVERDDLWEQHLPGITAANEQHVNGLNLWDWGALDVPDEETADGKTVAWAAEYLAQVRPKKLFFLTVAIDKPHAPWYAPRPYFDRLPADALKLPEVHVDDLKDVPDFAKQELIAPDGEHSRIVAAKAWPDAVRAYLASVAFADAQVGRLIAALEKSAVANNTIICLTSSRGLSLGEKQCWQSGSLWERGTHVPLTLYDPGVTQPDSVSDEPVSLIDLYPTLAELTRKDVPTNLDGSSLLPMLLDPGTKRVKPAIAVMGGADHASYAARSAGARYIRYADGSEEFYDHVTDPHEWTNLAAQPEHAEEKQALAQFFPKEWHSAERAAAQLAGKPGADGSIGFDLQSGDKLPAETSPAIAGHGMDVEVSLDALSDINRDSMLIAQGDAQNGWALHLVAGKPTATIFINGQATTISTEAPAPGPARLRLFVPGNGTLILGVTGQSEIVEKCPFPGGFPVQPAGGLGVGVAFPPLPDSKPFSGSMAHVWLTVLPP